MYIKEKIENLFLKFNILCLVYNILTCHFFMLTSMRLDLFLFFRTVLIICGIDATRWWRYLLDILVRIRRSNRTVSPDLHVHDANDPAPPHSKSGLWYLMMHGSTDPRMDPCFHVVYAKFWPYHQSAAAEIKTHQTKQRFSSLLLVNFWWAHVNFNSVFCL